MAITRDDVARLAGVSTATVSYVINNGPRPVAEETRQRVWRAIQQLDYHPSTIARSLKTRKTQTVGIIISDILNPILAAIAKNIEDLVIQRDYSLTLCNSDESPEREQRWLQMLLGRRVDGIVLQPTGANLPALASVLAAGEQLVLIDRRVPGVNADCVLFDNEAGASAGVGHLAALGHTRIGLLNLSSAVTPGQMRLAGYQRALRAAGLPVDARLIREGSLKAQDGYALAGELLDVSPPPTALFVSSNRLAQGVLQQVKERRLRMPDDLALCVFDDVGYYAYVSPSISAVFCDERHVAERCVQFLTDRISRSYDGEPRTALIPCQLRIRESSAGHIGA